MSDTFVRSFNHPGNGRDALIDLVDEAEKEAKAQLGGGVKQTRRWADHNTLEITWSLSG